MAEPDTCVPPTLFDTVGGMPFFVELVERFYRGVETDAVLAPLYDADDLDGARHRLATFLAQYWGGPTTYQRERGHPKLRMRHMTFPVGESERDAWLTHMRAAVDAGDPDPVVRHLLVDYFESAAEHLRNDERPRPDASR